MTMVEMPTSQIGLKALAEVHVKSAVDRLGKLVTHEDARIALDASLAVLRLARPHSPGVHFPVGDWDDLPWGGFRAG
ncbi:MAG: hypothetical protein HOP13_01175 [Alphaproteobacteria bacterium]|nr:hypothetical protein [Alphaproteobacteria bacterium]